ncbi:MAG: helix-turn-helix transcriptional regulator [Lachnospirales bacterium]
MKKLETNDWLVLNNIIYKIYSTKDLTEMRKTLLEQLKLLLDFDAADFFLAKENGEDGLVDGVGYNADLEGSANFDRMDYSRGIMYSGKCMVYRETDIIEDEVRVQSEFYKKLYIANRWHYSMQIILAYNKEFLGAITLYRTIGKDNFLYEDIFLLDMLKEHLAFRLYESRKRKNENVDKLSIKETVEKYQLTKREEDVLIKLMEGKDNNEICSELIISTNTLKKHILNIYRKMDINNRVQMFKMVREKS